MKQIVANGQAFGLKYASEARERFGTGIRSVLTFRLENTDYAAVKEAFSGLSTLVIKDGGKEYDHSDYSLLGEITDKMDGEYQVKIGKGLTVEEGLRKSLEEAQETIATISGKVIQSSEDALAVRRQIEQMYATSGAGDTEKILSINLCPDWEPGKHETGEVYKTDKAGVRQIWECIQAYDNGTYPGLTPTDPSWYTFHRPFHGTTPETAMEWVKPLGAHDIYKTGEQMRYTDGFIYKCLSDTAFSPEEYARAWEKVTG